MAETIGRADSWHDAKPLLPASESADADEFRGVAEQLWLEADMQRVPRYDIRAAQIAWLANAIKLAVEEIELIGNLRIDRKLLAERMERRLERGV